MKSDLPPVRQRALEAAREAARRRGVTAGEWLDAAILDTALQQGVAPKRSARPPYSCDEDADEPMRSPCRLDMTGDRLRGDLAEIGSLLRQALPRRAIEALECEVRRLAERVDNTRHAGADAATLERIERGVAEMRDALRTLIPAESLLGVARALQQLSHRIDRNSGSAQDPATLRQIEGALIAMRGIAARVASNDALAKLSDEVRGLAEKIDQAAGRIGGSVLSALEGRLAGLAEALEARNRTSRNGTPELGDLVKALIDKIERGQVARDGHSSLARLEELTAKLAEKLEAVHGALGHVVDRLAMVETEMRGTCTQGDARAVPTAPSSLPAEVPVPPPPVASTDPAALAPEAAAAAARQTSQPGAHAAAEGDSLEPRLPPDHPPKSGPGAVRGRNPGSPTDRVFNSEATPAPAKPSADTDCGGKSDFIAAARRAVQAANEQDIKQDRAAAAPEIVSASASPAGRIGKLGALIGVTTAVLTVLGGLQLARTLRGSADEAKLSALGQAAGGPAPPASAAATIAPPASQASPSGHLAAASGPRPPGTSPPSSVALDLATSRPAQ